MKSGFADAEMNVPSKIFVHCFIGAGAVVYTKGMHFRVGHLPEACRVPLEIRTVRQVHHVRGNQKARYADMDPMKLAHVRRDGLGLC